MIVHADCLEHMATMDAASVDAIVTDPPYGLSFMGKDWDHGIPGIPFWTSALRIAKPGAYLVAAGAPRTHHRLMCALEDAGWEIRDCLGWIYGSGFPKSESVSLAIDKKACRIEFEARFCRKPTKDELKAAWNGYRKTAGIKHNTYDGANRDPSKHGNPAAQSNIGKWGLTQTPHGMPEMMPATDAARQWEGWGTALKPAWEPIILARKPLDGTVAANVIKWGTGALNINASRVGTEDNLSGGASGDKKRSRPEYSPTDSTPGAVHMSRLNNGACVYHQPLGRWPANIIHDGSEEVLELFPQAKGNYATRGESKDGQIFGYGNDRGDEPRGFGDSGSAARFFYVAKASRREREAGLEGMETKQTVGGGGMNNTHPTVKPVALMRYLCRLVTPPNGLILDPFCGSGTTGIAAKEEGFRFIGIDNNAEYVEIAEKRVNHFSPMEVTA